MSLKPRITSPIIACRVRYGDMNGERTSSSLSTDDKGAPELVVLWIAMDESPEGTQDGGGSPRVGRMDFWYCKVVRGHFGCCGVSVAVAATRRMGEASHAEALEGAVLIPVMVYNNMRYTAGHLFIIVWWTRSNRPQQRAAALVYRLCCQ